MTPNELWAAGIAAARDTYIAAGVEVAEAACAARMPGWDVAVERLRAGERWDREHRQYRNGVAS